jgi:LemA protein
MFKHSKWAILPLFFVPFFFSSCNYNQLVNQDEGVKAAWSQVENQYQRRADLIPNVVNTVKGYASHEEETLTAVVEARAKATQVTVDPTNPESMEAYVAAQGAVTSSLSRLLVTVEAYPDLKADALFSDLLHQLEGTENRIAVARMDYNEAVRRFNSQIRQFPDFLYAQKFGFKAYSYYEAKEGAEEAPEVNFE